MLAIVGEQIKAISMQVNNAEKKIGEVDSRHEESASSYYGPRVHRMTAKMMTAAQLAEDLYSARSNNHKSNHTPTPKTTNTHPTS